jgi:ketosteroid isomerase-like protein
MSQENVEIVRRLWSAAERGDDQAVYALYDPGISWTSRTVGPLEGAGGTVHGHDGVRKFFRDLLEAFDERCLFCCSQGDGVGSGVVPRDRGSSPDPAAKREDDPPRHLPRVE